MVMLFSIVICIFSIVNVFLYYISICFSKSVHSKSALTNGMGQSFESSQSDCGVQKDTIGMFGRACYPLVNLQKTMENHHF